MERERRVSRTCWLIIHEDIGVKNVSKIFHPNNEGREVIAVYHDVEND